MTDFEFVITIVSIALASGLIGVRMIIGHMKWRVKQKNASRGGDSVGLGELESLVRDATLDANQPLVERLEALDRRVRALGEARPPARIELPAEEEPESAEKSIGRLSRRDRS